MDKQIGQLKELIKRQEELKTDTEKESTKGIDGLDKIAEKQQELRKLTENLRNQIKGNEGDESKDNEPKEGEQNSNQDNSQYQEPNLGLGTDKREPTISGRTNKFFKK